MFYENLVDVFDRYRFGPNRIFSVNESGVSNVQKKLLQLLVIKVKNGPG
jgi:hypothetical protein